MSDILPWIGVLILLACCIVPAVAMMTWGRDGRRVVDGKNGTDNRSSRNST